MKIYKCKVCEFETNKISDIANHYQFSHTIKHECVCEICEKKFKTERGYKIHLKYNTCQKKRNEKENKKLKNKLRIEENTKKYVVCPICNMNVKFYNLGFHKWKKHGDGIEYIIPRKSGIPGKSGIPSPFKGKKIEELYSPEKCAQIREKIGSPSGKGKTKDIELARREKISISIKERYREGWMPKAGRCKKIKYYSNIAGNVLLDGTWELNVAKYFDENNVNWKRNIKKFQYNNTIKNTISHYTPDFYLPDENKYIEVKGYETNLDKIKWSQFPENLEIWDKIELKLRKII